MGSFRCLLAQPVCLRMYLLLLDKCWGDVIRNKIFVLLLLLKPFLTRSLKTDERVC